MDMKQFLSDRFDILPDNELLAMSTCMYIRDNGGDADEYVYDTIREDMSASWHMEGLSKLVLFFDEYLDVVVKIPFLGTCFVPDSFFDNDNYEGYLQSSWLHPEVEYVFDNYDILHDIKEYKGASRWGFYDCDVRDYCAAEAYISNELPKSIEDMFCRTKHLFDYRRGGIRIPVYIQEKCEEDFYDCNVNISYEFYTIASGSEKYYRNGFYLETDACACAIDQYGEKAVDALYDFLAAYKIDDMHNANVMLDYDGKLRLVDFSGYRH